MLSRGVRPLMADRHLEQDCPELRARWSGFAFNAQWDAKAKAAIELLEPLGTPEWIDGQHFDLVTAHYASIPRTAESLR